MIDKKKMPSLYYTFIDYNTFHKLEISLFEYCVADLIWVCSHAQKSLYPGWCYLSDRVMAKLFDVNERTIHRTSISLLQKRLIEKNTLSHKRPTQKWDTGMTMVLDDSEGIIHQRGLAETIRCCYCGISFLKAPIQIDHFIPKANNGSNHSENLVYACRSCNYLKKDMTGTEFITFLNGKN